MSFSFSDLISTKVSASFSDLASTSLNRHKEELLLALNNFKQYVSYLETTYFVPAEAPPFLEIFGTLTQLSAAVQSNHHLEEYALLDGSVGAFIDHLDEEIESLADRVEKWQNRKVIGGTKQAAELFGVSRSTIYRWIKKNKINARKQGWFWEIAV